MRFRPWWMFAVVAMAGCRDGEDAPPPPGTDGAGAAPVRAVTLTLLAPDTVGWNQTDSARIIVSNGTGSALPESRVELLAEPGLAVFADSARIAARDSAPGGTRLELLLRPLQPGVADSVTVIVRLPPAPVPPATAPLRYGLRATLAGRSLAREDTVVVRPGSERVSGGCASPQPPSAQRYGVGPVRVGMPERALRGACPEARDSTWELEGMPERGLVARPGGVPVLARIAGDSVTLIEVSDPRVRTAAGVGVGTPLAALRTRYGRACGGVGEGVVAVWFQNAPGISFQLDSTSARAWVAETGGEGEPPDSATVERFLIHGQDSRCPADSR